MTRLDCNVFAVRLDVTQESAAAMPNVATPAHVQRPCPLWRAPMMFALGILFVPLSACQTLGQEEGFLPDTIRSAGAVLKPGDYPDLSKIPDAPKDLPSEKSWAALQSGLQADAKVVAANPGSKPIAAGEIDQTWAKAEKRSIESNSASAQTTQTDAESDAWAAAARAKMEADIARLPPT
ncbi:MAG: hypothetical protein CFE32_08520 [Alphaproteobacteria bacterium PA3]|nr:MAG: hypothetical protein CFE32_08520 [Alphaproteobacteria bacterium PA3]